MFCLHRLIPQHMEEQRGLGKGVFFALFLGCFFNAVPWTADVEYGMLDVNGTSIAPLSGSYL